jgi:hypothetical protein
MRRVVSGAWLLCGIAFASPAAAQEAPGAQPAKPDKVICRREETVGTLFQKTVCLTRSQWKARDQAARDNRDRLTDELNRRPTQIPLPGTPTGGGG